MLLLAPVSVIARHVHLVEIRRHTLAVRDEVDLPVKKARKVGVRLRHQLCFSFPLKLGEQLTVSD